MEERSDNMNYLKQYVQNHPDNRMAWYLLGKQYVLEGKDAKANYCFLQAGSIYEAYERKQHPMAKGPQQMIQVWNRKRRIRTLFRRSIVIAVLLLGGLMALPHMGPSSLPGEDSMEAALGGEQTQNGMKEQMQVVLMNPAVNRPLGKSLELLLEGESKPSDYGLSVMLEQLGSWRSWTGDTRILLSTRKQGEGEAYQIQMHDSGVCECQPSDATEAFEKWNSWSGMQEERWTLSSAISQYRELYGKWPTAIEDLIRPYPNNVISGGTAGMRKLFPAMLQTMKALPGSGEVGASSEAGQMNSASRDTLPNGGADQLPGAPLSIVVDMDTHRLAVVSGDVIVRSYPVGLGGEKTPPGNFYISEKVKNPNGKDDGEFGSRGMTLSGTLYAIHGTNEPDSIGKDESHGCIRMGKEDVEELYDLVPLGTKVNIKSGVLPEEPQPPVKRFRLQPTQDETNPAVVYRWLS
ncbi:L,D-transpeptidase [Paenibacillus mendelii]|uniref:L,D-transpeptidase n=1 Tax=Paenibacillus mendelii TaxID=206163 RepID=A0ABV6JCD8_9BACL|nr:L,D-transpeptidase [Paenibacillus mendelii]MCQ6563010.1 L,D-transpeptidase [Paenibacillus mendelii]